MTASRFESVRGMRDVLPEETSLWAAAEATLRRVLQSYGYREMRIPLIEYTALFQRSIGEVTDIVEKEMYTFPDRKGDSLTLRPEATAGFARAAIENGLLHNQTQKLWCIGPMFRYEKPQAGRYRQFHQLDVEAFGLPGPDVDAELLCMLGRIWREFALDSVSLQINSLGDTDARARFKEQLIAYFGRHQDQLDDDSRHRLHRNPLRILDSKNPALAELIDAAPRLADFLDDDAKRHFDGLQSLLDAAGVAYSVNPRLVRGLDYYNKTVFEWVASDGLGAQNTVCGGGRYDGLVAHLGGRATPGIGFGLGLERLVLMLSEAAHRLPDDGPDVYLVAAGSDAERRALAVSERLRDQVPGLRVSVNHGGGSFKAQFKRADRSGAAYALVIGADELSTDTVGVKALRGANAEQGSKDQQQTLSEPQLAEFFSAYQRGRR